MIKPYDSGDLLCISPQNSYFYTPMCLFAGNELKILMLDIEDMKLYRRELLAKNHVPLYLPMAPPVVASNGYMDNITVATPTVVSFEMAFDFRWFHSSVFYKFAYFPFVYRSVSDLSISRVFSFWYL